MGFFNKVEFKETPTLQGKIAYLNVTAKRLDLAINEGLKQISATKNEEFKLHLEEDLKKMEDYAEKLSTKILELRREERKALINKIDNTKKILKKLRQKQEIHEKQTQQPLRKAA